MDARHALAGAAGAEHELAQHRGFLGQLLDIVLAEDDVGGVVEIAAGGFQKIRQMIDQRFEQVHISGSRLEFFLSAAFLGHRVERRRLGKAHGHQHLLRQHEAGRRGQPRLVA